MFVKEAASSHSSSSTFDGADRKKIKELINHEMGEDAPYLEGAVIPVGEISRLMKKAHALWKKHNEAETSYKAPQTSAWYEMLFKPLIEEGMRSENVEDLASLYAWVSTCRFAFGLQAGQDYPPEMREVKKTIRAKLEHCIQGDSNTILQLLVLLSQTEMKGVDYAGMNSLSQLLCHLYYYIPSVTLEDLIALCQAEIKNLLSPRSNSNFYLACLITCKAEKLLADASKEEIEAFLNAFEKTAFSLSFHCSLAKRFIAIVRPGLVEEKVDYRNAHAWISQIASALSNDSSSNIKTIYG